MDIMVKVKSRLPPDKCGAVFAIERKRYTPSYLATLKNIKSKQTFPIFAERDGDRKATVCLHRFGIQPTHFWK
ncbi:unnamed protein product [Callosobruchus maculatus]|uniref:Uncharacterized protein n=1 Tax=Callosobruchus maculatus TaxID=64391 RepID=A0A653BJ27_CALMS|nr:unnamed protein product [Callosobruchus maculatus]